ncbi:MAG: chloride channel protein [Aquificae bacterium]|nr:chloride channel protein [Aquificota bacterium]
MKQSPLVKLVLVPAVLGLLVGLSNYLLLTGTEKLFSLTVKLTGYALEFPVEEYKDALRAFKEPIVYPLLLVLSALAVGLIKYAFIGREGVLEGTGNFVIKSFHEGKGFTVKGELARALSAVLTVGAGGTAGLFAPAASVGSAWGAALAKKAGERRVLVASGFGAGIASMFGAPLAGALIAAEAFYKFDFEVGVLVPASVASVVAYVVSSELTGYGFTYHLAVEELALSAETLLHFLFFGLLTGLFVRLYASLLERTGSFFRRLPLPTFLVPPLGALLAALVVLLNPLSFGRGELLLEPLAEGQVRSLLLLALTPVTVALASALLLTAGNGGGIFAPASFAGAFLGAFYAELFKLDVPTFVLLGMTASFGAGAKMPVSSLIVVAEMTGGYEMLVPAAATVGTAMLASGRKSFFPAQVERRFESPAHREEFELYALKAIKVKEFMSAPVYAVSPDETLREVWVKLLKLGVSGFPVVENGKLVGVVTKEDLLKHLHELERKTVAEVMTEEPTVVSGEETLYKALRLMTERGVGRLPVLDEEGNLVGIVTVTDLGRAVKRFFDERAP